MWIPASLQAWGAVFPFAISTSICRSTATICSGLYFFMDNDRTSPSSGFSLIPPGTKSAGQAKFAAAAGENERTAGETCPVLLATVGREPSDETFICQHTGADRWAVASVGIAQAAAAPKKTIPISPRNGEMSEKAGSGSRDDGLSGPGEDRSEPPERRTVREGLSWKPMGLYSRVPEGQKTSSSEEVSGC